MRKIDSAEPLLNVEKNLDAEHFFKRFEINLVGESSDFIHTKLLLRRTHNNNISANSRATPMTNTSWEERSVRLSNTLEFQRTPSYPKSPVSYDCLSFSQVFASINVIFKGRWKFNVRGLYSKTISIKSCGEYHIKDSVCVYKNLKLIIFCRQGKLPKHRHQQRQLVFQVCSRSHFHDATYVFKEQSIPRAARLHSMLTTLLAAGPANACDPHAGRKERAAASPDRTGQHCCLPHDGRQCAVPLGPRVGLRRRRLGPRGRRQRTAAGSGHVRLLVGQGAQALAPPSPTSCALLLSYEASEFQCSLWWG